LAEHAEDVCERTAPCQRCGAYSQIGEHAFWQRCRRKQRPYPRHIGCSTRKNVEAVVRFGASLGAIQILR